MITFLYGRSGSGKTYTVTKEIGDRLLHGEHVILLCPEQEAVIAESRLTAAFRGTIPTENLEILNFGRLPERVSREAGGRCVTELGSGGRRLLMHRALSDAAPFLKEYAAAANDRSLGGGALLDKLLSAVTECKMGCVTPGALEEVAGKLSHGAYRTLGDKVADLSLIYALYEQYLHREYRDPEDMLAYLDTVLTDTDGTFFRGKTVYLDGFNGFTAQQYHVIRHIFRYADHVTVSLGCDADGEREWMFRRIYETESGLFSVLRDIGKQAKVCHLTENHRTAEPALLYLSQNLWRMGEHLQSPPSVGTAVRVFSCKTPFEEAEAVAADIRRYVMAGGRYCDVTVITRGMERYEGILDVMFEKYGIPLFMARRTPLTTKPLFRCLRHISAMVCRGVHRSEVIGYLKTGFSGISEDDVFLFETYCNAWNLSGRAFTDGEDWNMNPAGYKAEITEDDLAVLDTVNRVKAVLCDTVFPFVAELRTAGEDVSRRAGRLFSFLRDMSVPALLAELAAWERAAGEVSAADETEQLWGIFVNALDTLVTVAGDTVVTAETFFSLFDLVISDIDIGTIPARLDEVTAGDASLLRPDHAKRVYLIGCIDGAFPLTPTEDALLSDFDRSVLAGLGITLSAGGNDAMQDEMFHFWYAAVSAADCLTVSYPLADLQGKSYRPSSGVERILSMFPDITPYDPLDLPTEERILTRDTILSGYAKERVRDANSPISHALSDVLTAFAKEDEVLARRFSSLTLPLKQYRNRLNTETLALLFGNGARGGGLLSMTQSRLESYALCHFAYFCGYVLQLREEKRINFGTADIGSFIHYILEHFMAIYIHDPQPEKYKDDAVLSSCMEGLISDYMAELPGLRGGAGHTARVTHLLERLRTSATVIARNLIREFEHSDFRPRDFELRVGEKRGGEDDDHVIAPLQIDRDDGTRIRLWGTVDRVDTYEENGVTYVRVVDYKTYAKKFSLDDVAAGLNLQMLLYLFAVWKNGGERYGENLRPAGVLYMSVDPAETIVTGIPTKEDAESKAEEGLKRTGLFLDEPAVLCAMDHDLAGEFIPVTRKKDGTFKKGAPIETLEGFGALLRDVENTVCALTKEMTTGNADIAPISKTNPETGRDPCAYCAMRAVCRI